MKHKYKLIKEYPGSPKKGFVVDSKDKKDNMYYIIDGNWIVDNIIECDTTGCWKKIEPLFYTEDFKDGSFPQKNCDNCALGGQVDTCNEYCGEEFYNWHDKSGNTKAKGEPIYRDDNCWLVYDQPLITIAYGPFTGVYPETEGKYFSNEQNARNYYNKLENKKIKIIANKLGFKIGNKIWNKVSGSYLGEIKNFQIIGKDLCFTTTSNDLWTINDNDTNKVAIHITTEEDFEFIKNRLNKDIPNRSYFKGKDKLYITVNTLDYGNHTLFNDKYDKSDWLLLSVDEYMKSIGEKPLFITEDGKSIYQGMEYWYYSIALRGSMKNKAICGGLGSIYQTFSTKKLAQDYMDSLKPELKKGKWYESEGDYMYYQGNDEDYGFCDNFWVKGDWILHNNWKPANMNKVEKLLLKKAKRDYKDGDKYKNAYNQEYYGYFNSNKIKYYKETDQILDFGGVPLYYKGNWAEIVEKPLFKDENNKFWYKNDFKEDDIYYINYIKRNDYIFKLKNIRGNKIYDECNISIDYYEFNKDNSPLIYLKDITSIRKASKEEKEWLLKCEKLNAYVPKDNGKFSLKITEESLPYIAKIYDKYVYENYTSYIKRSLQINKFIISHNLANNNYIFDEKPGSNYIIDNPDNKYPEISLQKFCELMGLKYENKVVKIDVPKGYEYAYHSERKFDNIKLTEIVFKKLKKTN